MVYDPFRCVFESQFAQICGQIDFKSQFAFGICNKILLVLWCKIIEGLIWVLVSSLVARATKGRICPGKVVRSTQGSSWGYLKVNSSQTLSIFGDKCPQNGSENEQRAPRTSMGCPHIGPFVATHKTRPSLKLDSYACPGRGNVG